MTLARLTPKETDRARADEAGVLLGKALASPTHVDPEVGDYLTAKQRLLAASADYLANRPRP